MLYQARMTMIGAALLVSLSLCPSLAEMTRGAPAPDIQGTDITGKPISLDELLGRNPYVLVVYCFTPNTGEALAQRLQKLQLDHGIDKFQVVALGIEQDEAALTDFAQRLGLRYFVLDSKKLENTAWIAAEQRYPLTLIIETTDRRRIDHVLRGEGATPANLMTQIAENLMRQRRKEALEVIQDVAAEAESPEIIALRGYILAGEGKLDEAEAEFGSIDSATGLAKVALERGNYAETVALATRAGNDPFALSLKAEALAHQGKVEDAVLVLNQADIENSDIPWQQSEVLNSRGRIKHHQGDVDAAIEDYRAARELDSYGLKPLSNEASAHREQGNLEEAEQLLVQAQRFGEDTLVAILLEQVRKEQAAANDLQRQEFIRGQIQSLAERYRELREAGVETPADTWSTRPLTVAFLSAGGSGGPGVFFERAGTDTALQFEIEGRLQSDPRVQVLERAMLEYLLQELELGSSDLADPNTQQVLGRVLSARYLGFFDYAQLGATPTLYLRLVDTETTALALQVSQEIEGNLAVTADHAATAIISGLADNNELKGLIAAVTDEENVIINLGRMHGVVAGQVFEVLAEGDPIEVGGRVIAHQRRVIGRIEITNIEDEYAICAILRTREGNAIEQGMKVKAADAAPSST